MEEYTLLPDGTMRVRATTSVGAGSVTADSIYSRSGSSRDELIRRKQAARQ
jgi:hypothetical protein